MKYLLACLLCLIAATVANAEFYVAGDAFQSQFSGPKVDGTWKQDLIRGGSQLDSTSLGWDAGLGYRFVGGDSLWSRSWSVEAGYRNFGQVGAGGNWVSDEKYTEVMAHGEQCLHGVVAPYMSAVDKLEGGYVRTMRGFDLGAGFEPFLSAGVFVAQHRLYINGRSQSSYSGMVAGPTIGGGLKYDVYRGIKLRVSVDSHWTISESQHPISSRWVTVGGGLEVPLNFF